VHVETATTSQDKGQERPTGVAFHGIKVLIICDVRLYREGLERGLKGHPATAAVHVASELDDAFAEIDQWSPQVVLLDTSSPKPSERIEAVLARAPRARVVAFGVTEEPDTIMACVEAGAVGYVTRDASLEQLTATVQAVARGDVLCSAQVAGLLFRRVAYLAAERRPTPDLTVLTSREREVLALIDQGMSNKEIAKRLRLRVATVKNHVHQVLRKLGVSRRGAAAALVRGTFPGATRERGVREFYR
jgi:two-component system, NarL family, nitrate/nitrite response regulator NarL